MTAGDEEAAGEPVTDLTCEWGGVGGMGAVEGAWRARTLTAISDKRTVESFLQRALHKL